MGHTTPKWIWIKSPDLCKRLSKPSNLMSKGSKKTSLKIPSRKIFLGIAPTRDWTRDLSVWGLTHCWLSHGDEKIWVKKTSVHKANTKNCVMFMSRSFFPQNFLPPWLSQQCIRPQTKRSLVQSRVGAMSKKNFAWGDFQTWFFGTLGHQVWRFG